MQIYGAYYSVALLVGMCVSHMKSNIKVQAHSKYTNGDSITMDCIIWMVKFRRT